MNNAPSQVEYIYSYFESLKEENREDEDIDEKD
jgi:hypothetical protein